MNDGPAARPTLDALLAQRAWVRALARRLVRDADSADEIEQQAWLGAVASPPAHAESPRGWLGATLRNAARKLGRARTRRDRHEAAAPPRPETRTPDEVVADAELQQLIGRLVLALPEPYRTTVLLRYFEGLDAPEIGRRQGVPPETVRTRVRRAVAMLRRHLDDEHRGDRRAWVVACGRWGRDDAPAAVTAGAAVLSGGLAMTISQKVAAAVAVLVLATVAGLALRGGSPDAAPPADVAAPLTPGPERGARPAAPSRAARTESQPVPPAPAPDTSLAAERATELPPEFVQAPPLVVVVTCGGRPVARCTFAIARPTGDPRPVARVGTDSDGTYRLGVDDDVDLPARIIVRAPGWPDAEVVVVARERPVEVRLAEGGRVRGVVRFPDGRAASGVQVTIAGRAETTGPDGRFALDDVAVGRHERAQVAAATFVRTVPCDAEVAAPGATRDTTLVVDESVSLRVRVVRTADGAPIAGLTVTAEGWGDDGWNSVRAETGADGVAELRGLRDGDYRVAAFGDDIEAVFDPRVPVPQEDVVELRARPYVLRRLAGRVVDERGRGLAAMDVSLYVAHVADTHRATTRADGSFEFTGVRPFSWKGRDATSAVPVDTLNVTVRGRDPGDFLTLFVPPRDDVTIVWAPATTLSLVLADPSGAPLPDAHLQFDADVAPSVSGSRDEATAARANGCASVSRDVRSDGKRASRRIDWRARFAVPATLVVQLADGRRIERRVTSLDGDRTSLGDLTLEPVGRLRLSVSPPVQDAPVEICRRSDDGSLARLGIVTAQSRGLSSAIPAGRHRLVACARGRLAADLGEIEIVANGITEVAARLPRPAIAAVFVRRAGRPVEGAAVAVEGPDGGSPASVPTDAAGRAVLRNLSPGPARFLVRAPDGTERVVERTLGEGGRDTVDVEL